MKQPDPGQAFGITELRLDRQASGGTTGGHGVSPERLKCFGGLI